MKEMRKDELTRLKVDGEKFDELFGTKVKEKTVEAPAPIDAFEGMLNSNPMAAEAFRNMTQKKQDMMRIWVGNATQETTRAKRVAKALSELTTR
jgi:uncharacterized protein YdeI (YjbR/CyaY-like superfamily)